MFLCKHLRSKKYDMKNSNQVTIKDIARMLNISPATVSRALKDHPDISKKTKKQVVALARELNYHPNSVALSLRNNRTNTIGVIVPEIVHYFFASVISGIEDVAYSAGYHVMVCQSNESYEREVINVNALISNRVDGVLVSVSRETQDFSHLQNLVDRGIPLVFFDRICEQVNTHSVQVEDFEGAFKAVRHLIAQGCTRVAHLAGPETLRISRRRLAGYQEALQLQGLPLRPELVMVADNQQAAMQATRQLMALPESPDAILTVNDNAAVGVVMAAKEMGISIPDQLSVIGFSDDKRVTSLIEPALSSVGQPAFEMGQEAARLFLQQVRQESGNLVPVQKMLGTELVVRASSYRRVDALQGS